MFRTNMRTRVGLCTGQNLGCCPHLGFLFTFQQVFETMFERVVMDTKVKAAEQHLWLIRADRERVANSEAATIPAALRAGLTPERIAQIVCVSVEHINQFQEGGT